MAVSPGTKSLFATFFAFALIAAGTAYALKHREQLFRAAEGAKTTAAASKHAETPPSDDVIENVNGSEVELKANPRGHFETSAEINGRSIEVMVDTGATMVALTAEDAERAGIYTSARDFTHSAHTANGTAKVAPVRISQISIGGITVRDVDGAVAETGKLNQSLLGMSFLKKLNGVEMRGKSLFLRE